MHTTSRMHADKEGGREGGREGFRACRIGVACETLPVSFSSEVWRNCPSYQVEWESSTRRCELWTPKPEYYATAIGIECWYVVLPAATSTSSSVEPSSSSTQPASTTPAPPHTTLAPTTQPSSTTPAPPHTTTTPAPVVACEAGRYLWRRECTPCPSRSKSIAGSTSCTCEDGFKRMDETAITQGCLIRIQADAGAAAGFRRVFKESFKNGGFQRACGACCLKTQR